MEVKKMEIWKDIIGYEGYYQISSEGRVKSLISNKILIGDTNNLGYKRVILYTPIKKRFFIHRLVALHFCEGYAENLIVNHKDGNKQNNKAENLEWVTHSQNDLHAFQNNLREAYPCTFEEFCDNIAEVNFFNPEDRKTADISEILVDARNFLALTEREEDRLYEENNGYIE